MALIAVINKSTMLKNTDVQLMCKAIQIQMDLQFCPAWGLKPSTIIFYADETKVPGHAWLFSMIDNDTSVPGALGYHTLNAKGQVQAFIMAKPILDPSAGGVVLYDANNPNNYSVSGCLSHEVLEALGDRFANAYVFGTQISQGSLYALEVADPVENTNVVVSVDGSKVFVSNFVFPSWFNPEATAANMPFDYCHSLSRPFQLASGGYMVVGNSTSDLTQVFGYDMPEWRRAMKKSPLSRAGRRVGAKLGFWKRLVKWIAG